MHALLLVSYILSVTSYYIIDPQVVAFPFVSYILCQQ